jgi:hypothetical protein
MRSSVFFTVLIALLLQVVSAAPVEDKRSDGGVDERDYPGNKYWKVSPTSRLSGLASRANVANCSDPMMTLMRGITPATNTGR